MCQIISQNTLFALEVDLRLLQIVFPELYVVGVRDHLTRLVQHDPVAARRLPGSNQVYYLVFYKLYAVCSVHPFDQDVYTLFSGSGHVLSDIISSDGYLAMSPVHKDCQLDGLRSAQ